MVNQKESHYRDIFDHMQELFFICEIILDDSGKPVDFRYLDVNPACALHAQLRPDDIVGRTYLELFPSDPTFTNYLSSFYQVAFSGISSRFEQFTQSTGKFFDVFVSSAKKGQCIVLMNDITDCKKAEIKLRESELRYQAIFNNNHAPILLVDPTNGNVIDANPAACLFYGWNHDLIITKNITAINTLDPALVKTELQKALQGNHPPFLFKHCLANDEIRDVEVFSGPIQYNGSTLLLSIIHDITDRKKDEEKLRQSENRYRSLFQNMLNGFAYCQMIFDHENVPLDFIYLEVNDAFGKQTGLIDVTGKKASEAIPGIRQSDPQLFEIYGRVALTGKPESFESYVESMKMWFSIAVYSPQKGFFVAVFDVITERKQAEEALRQSEARFRSAFESSPVGMALVSLDTRLMQVNPSFCRILGYSEEEVLGRNIMEFTHPDDILLSNNTRHHIVRGEDKNNRIEKRYIRKDGSVIWGNASAARFLDENGQPLYMISQLMDITERKLVEDEIRRLNADLEFRVQERTRELSDLFNNAPCGYHSLDENGMFVNINDTELKWLGYSRDEIVGKKRFGDLITPQSLLFFKENFPLFKIRGWIRDLEFDMVRKDGSILPVLVNATTIKDSDGRFIMSRSTVLDYTHRKRSEQKQKEIQTRLEAANKELEAFSYSVSHDLRSPLRGIDGWSLALAEDYRDQLDEKGRQYIDIVRKETQRMGQLIDDLLRLSRLSRAEMNITNVNLSAMVKTISDRIQEAQPDLPAEWVIQPDLVAVGDANLLEIALTNLLSNAFKFSRTNPHAVIEFGNTSLNGQTAFYVRDNGVGFNMEYAKNLFGAFQRMHKQSEFPGTGIGLATVQRIINRHNGRVWAEAEKNVGATFYFNLGEQL